MKSGQALSKWQRRSIGALAITAIVIVPTLFMLVLSAAERFIFDYSWYIAGAGIAVYAVVFIAWTVWDALVLAEMHGPLPMKNAGHLGGLTDKITDTVISVLHRRDRKRSAQ